MGQPNPIPALLRHVSAVILVALAGAGWAQQQDAPDVAELLARYPKGSIDSVETADRALAEISRTRKAIKARYEREEQACLPNFFTTSCIDKAKEAQRVDLNRLRPLELESNTFKRQAKVEKRDADVQERQERADARRLEAERSPPAPLRVPRAAPPDQPVTHGSSSTADERVAEHEAKLKALQAKEQAEAPQRAERAAAYERKQQASLKRQEEVARRKTEKEARRRAKEQAGEARASEIVRP